MKNENEIMVLPLNSEKILLLLKAIIKQEENQEFKIDTGALCNNAMVVDSDCCYNILEKRVVLGKIQDVYDVPVRVIKITETGRSYPMFVSFYLPITLEDLPLYTDAPISLKEFMGSRHDYNPRIKANMKDFLEDANATLIQ